MSIFFIELALKERANSFIQLEKQMDEFKPLALDAFQHKWQQMWDQMRPLNAEMSDEDLKLYIDLQISEGYSYDWQYYNTFIQTFSAEVVAITVLSHALVEATINAVLAEALGYIGKPSLFLILEKANVKDKWTIGPQSFLPNYAFAKSDALFEGLSTLNQRRIGYAHSKTNLLNEDNKPIVSETNPSLSMCKEQRKLLHRFLSLPYELHQNLLNQIEDRSLRFRLEHIIKKT
jgi:hypothetical protein